MTIQPSGQKKPKEVRLCITLETARFMASADQCLPIVARCQGFANLDIPQIQTRIDHEAKSICKYPKSEPTLQNGEE